jgi:hypothetical protein
MSNLLTRAAALLAFAIGEMASLRLSPHSAVIRLS